MDSEFLALSLVFILVGITGIILFNGPMTPSGDSCYCIIPSPEPHAAQGTSSILVALGVLFFPMGLLKGGLPSFGKGGAAKVTLPSGRVFTPLQISSGALFAFGILMVVAGVDALAVPGYLVMKNMVFVGAGAAVAVLGALAIYWGSRSSEPKPEE